MLHSLTFDSGFPLVLPELSQAGFSYIGNLLSEEVIECMPVCLHQLWAFICHFCFCTFGIPSYSQTLICQWLFWSWLFLSWSHHSQFLALLDYVLFLPHGLLTCLDVSKPREFEMLVESCTCLDHCFSSLRKSSMCVVRWVQWYCNWEWNSQTFFRASSWLEAFAPDYF